MSTYRRSQQQHRTQRWFAQEGVWRECEYDEPETRKRNPEKEGLIVVPTEDFESEGPAIIPIDLLIEALQTQLANGDTHGYGST